MKKHFCDVPNCGKECYPFDGLIYWDLAEFVDFEFYERRMRARIEINVSGVEVYDMCGEHLKEFRKKVLAQIQKNWEDPKFYGNHK